jgi:capsular polysaccharide biosynthesis protein
MLTFGVRDAWWMIGIPLYVAAAFVAVGLLGDPRYSAESKLVVVAAVEGTTDELIRATSALNDEVLANTLADVLHTGTVTSGAREVIGTAPTAEFELTTTRVPVSNVIEIAVTGDNARATASYANAIAEVGAFQFSELYPLFAAEVVSRADPAQPATAGASKVERAIAGGVLGVAIALAVGWQVDRRRSRKLVSTGELVVKHSDRPTLENLRRSEAVAPTPLTERR